MAERGGRRWGQSVPLALGTGLVLSGLVLAPFAVPVLPIETYIRYAQVLGESKHFEQARAVER